MERREVRPIVLELVKALKLDEWPSNAACTDFGISSSSHLGALQYAVIHDGVTVEQLDEALGKGAALQALVSSTNPYRSVTFRTAWDDLGEEPEEVEGIRTIAK